MHIRTAQSGKSDIPQAIEDLVAGLGVADRGLPDFIALHFAVGHPAPDLALAAAAAFRDVALHGGSSCLGVMGSFGMDLGGTGLGALAIWDRGGSYGTASADLGEDAQSVAADTARRALLRAGRPSELPDMVWLTVAPGREEQVLAGLRSVVGPDTLIVGGSSADNDVSGQWAQFGPEAVHRDGLVVSVLFPTTPVASVYQSGYAPTGRTGQITRVTGRRLNEIDGRPAALVLQDWSGGAVPVATGEPISILAASTFWPLGRVTRHLAGVPFHLLAHPAVAHPDGSVDLFADLAHGDLLWQMQGSAESLVARAGRVAAQALETAGGLAAGAFVVYCGGCMLAVRDRMDEVVSDLTETLGDTPWIGVFTFGEQGVPVGDGARHANLMISCSVIAAAEA